MSKYSEQLGKLRKEILSISSRRKKRRWKRNQKAMIDFINGQTSKAIFDIKGSKLTLMEGDDRKGFKHILDKHYRSNDLSALDIINIAETFERGMLLAEEGVSNKDLDVFMFAKNGDKFKLVIKKECQESWIITFYRKD